MKVFIFRPTSGYKCLHCGGKVVNGKCSKCGMPYTVKH